MLFVSIVCLVFTNKYNKVNVFNCTQYKTILYTVHAGIVHCTSGYRAIVYKRDVGKWIVLYSFYSRFNLTLYDYLIVISVVAWRVWQECNTLLTLPIISILPLYRIRQVYELDIVIISDATLLTCSLNILWNHHSSSFRVIVRINDRY